MPRKNIDILFKYMCEYCMVAAVVNIITGFYLIFFKFLHELTDAL
jgi:uncharacterized membrane protein